MERKITAQRTRCHADYHLGQVLYTGKDFVVIDLEGQASRPLSDRRRKRSPLRDVASMLRSFHYAVASALEGGGVRGQDVPALRPWGRFWTVWVSAVFLNAYLEVATTDSFLPRARADVGALLDFFLLKRAANELSYEVANASERARVPIQGLLHLLNAGPAVRAEAAEGLKATADGRSP
jgi:maltose alpha-D-glucosyltransferase/alpha-amylase